MRRVIIAAVAVMGLVVAVVPRALAWGVWGHNHINKGAVLALPKEMGMFFYNHCDFMVEESIVPDIRKYTMGDKNEGCRHYINLEQYDFTTGASAAKNMKQATAKFGIDTMTKYGILPWYILEMQDKLTAAFRGRKKTEILFLAADLGHYVADAHMPLHTTSNHNGQYSGQEGIHAFWESQLPELFGKNYNLHVADAVFINDIDAVIWDMIDSSYRQSKTLLRAELKMKNDNPEDKQYVMGADGKPTKNKYNQPVHAYEYAHVYHEVLDGMVERQMKAAIKLTASLWYTAWVNAGRPDMKEMDPNYVTERNAVFYKADIKYWEKGKVRGCKTDKEF